MEDSVSRILVGSVVKRTLKDIKENPERSIRNLVDMALQFSGGRFQQDFFSVAQTMLQNENSAYYGLLRNIVEYTDIERLYSFGMNLGYNGCTLGARRIRDNEKKLKFNIPWTISMQIDAGRFNEKHPLYNSMIASGERLGIYTWMLFCEKQPGKALTLVKEHTDSAFCLFCNPADITPDFLDDAAECYNLMLVLRYDEDTDNRIAHLREKGMLYSLWYQYEQKDLEAIINGDLFYSAQQLSPLFTIMLPAQGCDDAIQKLVHQTVQQARMEQNYRTVLWDLEGDNRLIDTIISGDACSVYFDAAGDLCHSNGEVIKAHYNLFENSLSEILISAFPKR